MCNWGLCLALAASVADGYHRLFKTIAECTTNTFPLVQPVNTDLEFPLIF